MLRLACAIALGVVASAAVSSASKAMPISPLPTSVLTDTSDVVPVYYYRGHHYPYFWRGHYYRHRHFRHGRYNYR
jgi:hypothetical protein